MRVLVTRPRPDADRTASRLRALGHEPLIDPVLVIRAVPPGDVDPLGVAAVVLTSRNAAPALPRSLLDRPVFAVGAATAEAARAAGCSDVREGSGDGAALAARIGRELDPAAGTVLHLAGETVRPGLAEGLAATGHTVRREVAYVAEPLPAPGADAAGALRRGGVDAALFFSPRSAALWVDGALARGLAGAAGAVVACGLSEAVAEPLRSLPFRDLRVAVRPDESALLGCLATPGPRW